MVKNRNTVLKMYNGSKITSIGRVKLLCNRKSKFMPIEFLVVKEKVQPIISCKDSEKFGFIVILENDFVN